MAPDTKGNQILGRIITQAAPRLNVMDLKAFHTPTPLASPADSLPDSATELAMSFGIKPQAWPFGTHSSQSATWTFSRSCLICGFGRLSTSRVSEGKSAFWFPVSKLTPARKSAQIISKQ